MDHWNILLSANLLFMKSEYILVLLQCLSLFFVSKQEKDVCIVYCTCVHTQGICYKNVIYVLLPTR